MPDPTPLELMLQNLKLEFHSGRGLCVLKRAQALKNYTDTLPKGNDRSVLLMMSGELATIANMLIQEEEAKADPFDPRHNGEPESPS